MDGQGRERAVNKDGRGNNGDGEHREGAQVPLADRDANPAPEKGQPEDEFAYSPAVIVAKIFRDDPFQSSLAILPYCVPHRSYRLFAS